MVEQTPLVFVYRNWKGEVGVRRVRPLSIAHEESVYHGPAQWLMKAFDLDKQATRIFALRDVVVWGEESCRIHEENQALKARIQELTRQREALLNTLGLDSKTVGE